MRQKKRQRKRGIPRKLSPLFYRRTVKKKNPFIGSSDNESNGGKRGGCKVQKKIAVFAVSEGGHGGLMP